MNDSPRSVTPATADDLALLDSHFAAARSAAKAPVTLTKISDLVRSPAIANCEYAIPSCKFAPLPWYPLVGHRSGLRANDLVSLASAFFVLALEGGTAHMSADLEAAVDQASGWEYETLA